MSRLSSKLPHTGHSIFSVMSKMSADYGALNLAQGFPDFPLDPILLDHMDSSMRQGHNQYAPMAGVMELREEIAKDQSRSFHLTVDPVTEITITAGATEALFSSIQALVEAGDEVIMFDPCYDSYHPSVVMAGGVPIHLEMTFPEFKIDWNEVEQHINSRTKLIIINNPNNPMGTVWDQHDFNQLALLAEKYDLFVISDEVYSKLLYDNQQHLSVLAHPHLRHRSVAIHSFGKTFHATGWKVGYAIASTQITDEIRKLHQFITFSVNTPAQYAIAAYMKSFPDNTVSSLFQKKRDLFLQLLEPSIFTALPCQATYFQVVQYPEDITESDRTVVENMVKDYKVSAIPISVFYENGTNHRLLRFCFAKNDSTLKSAGAFIQKIQL